MQIAEANSIIETEPKFEAYFSSISNQLYLNYPEDAMADVRITDINGKVVLEQSISSGKTVFDLNAYNCGVYFIMLISEDKYSTKKILR